MSVVLDSSAVLAVLWAEPGAVEVMTRLERARISAVNAAEVVSRLVERGASDAAAEAAIPDLMVEVVPFDAAQALAAGLLRRATRPAGLSLGDRACLALAQAEGLPALTADRAWGDLHLGIAVEVIR